MSDHQHMRNLVGFVLVACLAGGVWYGVRYFRQRAASVDAFSGHLDEYLARANAYQPPPAGTRPPGLSDVIVVDMNTRTIDETVFFALPRSVRARRPDLVRVVVFLEYGDKVIRERTIGYRNQVQKDFGVTCQITAVHLSSGVLVGEAEVVGGGPGVLPSRNQDRSPQRYGSVPVDKIADAIQNLRPPVPGPAPPTPPAAPADPRPADPPAPDPPPADAPKDPPPAGEAPPADPGG